MSKHDIQTVCCLAAHLAQRYNGWIDQSVHFIRTPQTCAADAMKLQRLARRSKRAVNKLADYEVGKPHILPGRGIFDANEFGIEKDRILEEIEHILSPYGLRATVGGDPRGCCLHIIGLPGNTLGGDSEGYGL